MKCKLCGSNNTHIVYSGKIKMNLVHPIIATSEDVDVFQCEDCDVIWHNYIIPVDYYTSETYRKNIDVDTDIDEHYRRYDKNVLKKLNLTGTNIFRNKTIADVGCGGGSFLDFLIGVADTTIGIEPSDVLRGHIAQKTHKAYSYAANAIEEYENRVDVITSFDVIEHVEDPKKWLAELSRLLADNGKIIVGTPTDYPILRKFLGKQFEEFIFQIHHPWIFSEKSLVYLFSACGFTNIQIEQKYHFGIGNVINWLQNGTAQGDVKFDFFSDTLNDVWRREMVAKGLGEYLLVTANKGV